ncbi:MAG: RICIN domain-containing protein [Deltaproteobacteria bacterium]
MKQRSVRTAIGLVGAMLVAGCATDSAPGHEGDEADTDDGLGSAAEAVNACAGDDLQYDFNGFAASLAVAIANELGHWDVATDFVVANGRLALSPVGLARCTSNCENIKALLLMQEDVTSGVPYHNPSVFRSKLTGWYQAQLDKLVELTTASRFPPGTYRFKGRQSGKYIVVDNGSTVTGALIEQKAALSGTNGDWEVSVVGPKHKLKNIKSGLCLDLKTDSATNTDLVQKACSSADSQLFKMSKSGEGTAFLFETKHPGKGLTVAGYSTQDDAKITQTNFDKNQYSSQWNATLLNGAAQQGLFKGMYTIQASHSSKMMAVTDGLDGSAVAQYPYNAANPMQNWYAVPQGSNKYQLVNRSSGDCMALATDTATAKVVQKACANDDSQRFTITSTGSPDQFTLTSRYGKLLEVTGYSSADGALVGQAVPTAADPQRRFKLIPILAGEPHRLTFNHTTADAACGDYYWYDVTQPNGLPLANPAETFVQLIFAGGKKAMGTPDENPFIAQLSTGNQVAIDPSGYMLPGRASSSGSCIQSDILVDLTKMAAGSPPDVLALCCTKYNGVTGSFVKSSWSSTTFLCQ